HLLAFGVQPDPRATASHALRRRAQRQRAASSTAIRNRRARRECLLGDSMKRIAFFLALITLAGASLFAADKLKVVAATEDLASLTREVGGDRVEVNSIGRGYQDPHFIEPK